MLDTGPGPEDTAHLWGDYEAELALEDKPYDRTPPSRYRAPQPSRGRRSGSVPSRSATCTPPRPTPTGASSG